jgi:hypothetical protein
VFNNLFLEIDADDLVLAKLNALLDLLREK